MSSLTRLKQRIINVHDDIFSKKYFYFMLFIVHFLIILIIRLLCNDIFMQMIEKTDEDILLMIYPLRFSNLLPIIDIKNKIFIAKNNNAS